MPSSIVAIRTRGRKQRCHGSATIRWDNRTWRGPEMPTWSDKPSAVCLDCGRRVWLYPIGVRDLYPIEWRMKTHYVTVKGGR